MKTILFLTLCALGGSAFAAGNTSAPADGLLLDYSFQADANDSSGRNLHGTVHGNPRFEALDGRAGLVFDGAGDWVEADAKLPALVNEFTIECWVRPAAQQAANANIFGNHTSGGGLVLQQDAGNTNCYAFSYRIGADGAQLLAIPSSSGGWVTTKPIKLVAGRWQHVAMSGPEQNRTETEQNRTGRRNKTGFLRLAAAIDWWPVL